MAKVETIPAQYNITFTQDDFDRLSEALKDLFRTEPTWYHRNRLQTIAADVFDIDTYDYTDSQR